jgi:endonuclease-3
LFKKYKTAADYAHVPLSQLENDIKKINFYRHKAKAIQNACRILVEQYAGKVPNTLEELVKLPGIGRKTANAILVNAFNKVEGIVVDTHVIRLSQRLGFTKAKDPEKIEQDLMRLIPKPQWKRITWLMKDHGRAVCISRKPKCNECVVNELCPKIGVL